MKKVKILAMFGALLAMTVGVVGCNKKPSSSPEPEPAPSSAEPAPSSTTPAESSADEVPMGEDPTGHNWGADADVAASGEGVAYKKATCTDNDGAIRLTVNQSVVTYPSGSSRKDGTPDGYTKLSGNNQSLTFKFNYDSYATGKLYFFGCMDGWGSDSNHSAGLYYRDNPNIKVEVNGEEVDVSGSQSGSYETWFGSGTRTVGSQSLSPEGWAPIGNIVLQNGVNEFKYTRVQTLNMLIKDFVFVITNSEAPAHTHVWSEWSDVPGQEATCTQPGKEHRTCSAEGCDNPEQFRDKAALGHDWGEYGEADPAPTCVSLGKKERACKRTGCTAKESKDVNYLVHDLDLNTEVVRENTAGKKSFQYTCKNASGEKVISIPLENMVAANKTVPVEGETEKWTLGDAVTPTSFKLSNTDCVAVSYKVAVTQAVEKAIILVGAKYVNNDKRVTFFRGSGSSDSANGDACRYYTKINDGDFQPMTFNAPMVDVFGDGTQRAYMPLGEFDLAAGENTLIFRQSNLGYRVTFEGDLRIVLKGAAEIDGNAPAHTHTAADAWTSDESQHWHACVDAGGACDEPTWKSGAADHTFGEPYDEVAATCTTEGSYKVKCSVCNYVKTVKVAKLAHDLTPVAYKENGGKVSKLSTCSVGTEKIISVGMDQIVGANKTVAVEGQDEKWTIGDEITLQAGGSKDGGDGNLTVKNAYKLAKGVAIKFEVYVDQAIEGALLEVGAQYKNDGSRKWANMHDPTYNSNNGDKDTEDEWRYYAKVNDGEFFHPDYSADTLINSVLANGTVKYFSFGNINLQAGKNTIYLRQANLGYRVEPDTEIRILFKGDATITGTDYVPPHEHAWTEGATGTNSASFSYTQYSCECNDVSCKLDTLSNDNAAQISGGKLGHSQSFTWKFKPTKAGHVEFYMTVKKGSGNATIASGYSLASGGTAGTVTFIGESINSSTARLIKVGEVDVAALDANGEIPITLTTPASQDFRPVFQGDVYIYVH